MFAPATKCALPYVPLPRAYLPLLRWVAAKGTDCRNVLTAPVIASHNLRAVLPNMHIEIV